MTNTIDLDFAEQEFQACDLPSAVGYGNELLKGRVIAELSLDEISLLHLRESNTHPAKGSIYAVRLYWLTQVLHERRKLSNSGE